ncbi:MAG TPA: hypothetical protein VIK35_01165 [Verrucomicrobiae bacterium]
MNARVKQFVLLLLAAALLFTSGRVQNSLNRDRAVLGLTISGPLQDAPPLLAFTTVALGGFRGLISNYLWIRANGLQQDDKFFEAAQLADWITDLEPHFSQVWAFQSWNMAWNISVKFKDFSDRWRWVQRGIELLRDDGLNYNPNDTLLYQQLGWIFQNKMGENLDDANGYYKQQWAEEMTPFFGPDGTNFENLVHPQTLEDEKLVQTLTNKFKIDPVFAEKVNEEYGPLDWRLAESHAIYWGALGLEKAKEHSGKVKASDLITLRRLIYQSMLQAFHHGRIISNPFTDSVELVPNLNLIPKLNDTYLKMFADESDPAQKNGILTAHRNFLSDAVYFLYENDRMADAAKWYKLLGEKYPDKTILDHDTNSFPRNLTLDDYAVGRVQEEIGDTSQERTTGVVEGYLMHSYLDMAIGQDDRSAGYKQIAKEIYSHYITKTSRFGSNGERVKLPSFADLNRTVVNGLLDTQNPVIPYAARLQIRSQLGMPAETNAPPAPIILTNTPPEVATNAVENVPANSAAK